MTPLSCTFSFEVFFLFEPHKQAWNLSCPPTRGEKNGRHSVKLLQSCGQAREGESISSFVLLSPQEGFTGRGDTTFPSGLTSHRTAGFLLFSRRNDATSDTHTACVSVSQQMNRSQCVRELQQQDTRGRRHE